MKNVELEDLKAVRMQMDGKSFLRLMHEDGTAYWYTHTKLGWELVSIQGGTLRKKELEAIYWQAEARGAL